MMNTPEEAIERAARILAARELKKLRRDGAEYPDTDLLDGITRALTVARDLARDLAEAGLLSTSLPGQEWRATNGNGYAPAKTREQAQRAAIELNGEDEDDGHEGSWEVQCRLVSEWVPA